MKKIDEKELHSIFNEFKNRNQSAYNELYEKYYKLVYGVAFSVLKNKEDSEDIANEVFTKIYRLDKEKLPVSNEASWLFTVTRNECFSYLRKSRVNISIDEIYDIPSDSKEMQEIVDTDYYNKLISGLSEQEKTIISLKILSNFTFSKISQIMNIPIGTVQWKYYKAINSLKISIGSLAGAIIAFVLVFIRREKINGKEYLNNNSVYKDSENNINKSTENSNEMASESFVNETKEDVNLADKSGLSSSKDVGNAPESENKETNAELNNVETYTESNTCLVVDNRNIKTFRISCIVVGILLIIISLIFFKKYQQKLKKKSSK